MLPKTRSRPKPKRQLSINSEDPFCKIFDTQEALDKEF